MQQVKMSLVMLFGACLLAGCKPKHEYDYVPLKEYKYDHAKIEPGTEVEILAFSGGRKNDKENIYYYQFIVITKAGGDTLSILCPLIGTDDYSKTYASPLDYDAGKSGRDAVYQLPDSSHNLILQTDLLLQKNVPDTAVNVKAIMDGIVLDQFVVLNRSMSVFENQRYRTAIGILNFSKKTQ